MFNQILLFITIFHLFMVGKATVPENNEYTTKYDNIDLNDILHSERLLKNYVDCLLDKRPCTPDGLELKRNMPDALETDCSRCSKKQKEGSEIITQFLIDNKPELWKPLQEKYDPSGGYKQRYLDSKKEVSVQPLL